MGKSKRGSFRRYCASAAVHFVWQTVKASLAQSHPSQKVQDTSVHEVTSFKHFVMHALSDGWQRPSNVAPLSCGQSVATRSLAAVHVVRLVGAHPMKWPPPQTHAPVFPHCGNGQ